MSRPTSAARPRSASSSKAPPPSSSCCLPISRFLRPPAARHRCPIDNGVLRDAVTSRVCGHTFGLQCAIYRSIEHESCPVCGAALDASDLQPAEALRSEVSALHIHCAEGYDQCSWVGSVADEARHRNGPSCAVQRVDCPFCDVKGLLVGHQFEAHKDVCEECVVICPQCCDDMPRRLLAGHKRDCTAEAIEPLRRQMENLSRPTSPTQAAVAYPSSATPLKPFHRNAEPIEHDDDDAYGASPPPVAPPQVDETTFVPCDITAMPLDTTTDMTAVPACTNAQQRRGPSQEEFSPAPPQRSTNVAKEHVDVSTLAPPAPPIVAMVRLPCPMVGMGCDQQHTLEELASPHVLQHHMAVMVTAFGSLRSAHAQLQVKCDGLALVVEQQKKSLKMLDVRSALQSGKLNIPAPTRGAASGLVESPRVAAPLPPAAAPGPVPAPETEAREEAASTPRPRDSQAHAPSSANATPQKSESISVKKRSVSSPAAPDRTAADKSSATPMFVPSVPKKKAPVSTGAGGAPPRRPAAAATATTHMETKAAAAQKTVPQAAGTA